VRNGKKETGGEDTGGDHKRNAEIRVRVILNGKVSGFSNETPGDTVQDINGK